MIAQKYIWNSFGLIYYINIKTQCRNMQGVIMLPDKYFFINISDIFMEWQIFLER